MNWPEPLPRKWQRSLDKHQKIAAPYLEPGETLKLAFSGHQSGLGGRTAAAAFFAGLVIAAISPVGLVDLLIALLTVVGWVVWLVVVIIKGDIIDLGISVLLTDRHLYAVGRKLTLRGRRTTFVEKYERGFVNVRVVPSWWQSALLVGDRKINIPPRFGDLVKAIARAAAERAPGTTGRPGGVVFQAQPSGLKTRAAIAFALLVLLGAGGAALATYYADGGGDPVKPYTDPRGLVCPEPWVEDGLCPG